MEKKWDIFISYASEDEEFVRPLAEALTQLGIDVWFALSALKLGDSLSRSIDEGLSNCNFGLVVISQSFIRKKWTERELQGLVTRTIAEQLVVIPLWLDVTASEVSHFSPPLADTIALKVGGLSADQVALSILQRVRPDIYRAHARDQLANMIKGKALEQLQFELSKVKDELREVIATEIRNAVKAIGNAIVNAPVPLTKLRMIETEEGKRQYELQKNASRVIANVALEAAEDYLREAQARVVQKTDPKRAEIIRRLKPEF